MGYFRDNIEHMQGYTPGFQPKIGDVVKLNTNENPYPPCPGVIESIRSIEPEQIRRYPDPVGQSFRSAAANLHGLEPENIMCCNGGDDLLNLAIRAFCDCDRSVAYPVPTYSLYPVLAGIENCPVKEVAFDKEFNLPSKLARTQGSLTILCNPNAPSATFIDTGEIASLAEELKGVLLIDEAYVDFAETSCIELVKNFENVIILRSMSKGYSLAGMRFGYAAAAKNLIDGLMKVKDSYNVDAVAIAAATAAICDQQYFKNKIELIKEQRSMLSDGLRELGFEVPRSFTNFLFVTNKNYKAKYIYDRLIEADIFVRYFDLPGIDNKLRITVGTEKQNRILLEALSGIVSK